MHRLNHLRNLARTFNFELDVCVGRFEYVQYVKKLWPIPEFFILPPETQSKVAGLALSFIGEERRLAVIGILEETIDKNSNLVYYSGLHEIGHLANGHMIPDNLENEAQAWEWAFEHALEPMDWETEVHFKEHWFGSYVDKEDVFIHTAGPTYHQLKAKHGLNPKPQQPDFFFGELTEPKSDFNKYAKKWVFEPSLKDVYKIHE